MSKSFYGSLAAGNIKKNAKGYIPYMLTCIFSIMIFYIMLAIVYNPDVTKLLGGDVLRSLLAFGCGIVGIFSAIFLFYTNTVLIKQRKKELALYNILGMAKRHIGKVLLLEALFTSLASLITGLLAGVVLGKLFFLLLVKVLQVTLPLKYGFSMPAAVMSIVVFSAIFAVVLLCNLGRLRLSSPMELLAGSRQGEKEPKTKWVLVVLGLITMGIGYYIAITVTSPLQALMIFFIAVLLVIAGTYLLFTAGSIALLKLLRKKKNFYYKTEHFTAVSGMLYRMKKNAAGLASICILSTMVLVTISTTVSMQMGLTDVINKNFPDDLQGKVTSQLTAQQQRDLQEVMKETAQENHVKVTSMTSYKYLVCNGAREGNQLMPLNKVSLDKSTIQMYFISVKGSSMESKYGPLAKDEVIIGGDKEVDAATLNLGSMDLKIKDGASDFKGSPDLGSIADAYYILVADDEVKDQIQKHFESDLMQSKYYIGMDVDKSSWDQLPSTAKKILKNTTAYDLYVDDKASASSNFHIIYGGLLFVGIFLGLLFLMATVLIIYYKQISEGYEDSERYHIMQKVGMSTAEVKKSIKSQILIVFFLPLIVAVIHVAAAFNMMSKLLTALYLDNIWLFVGCTAATILLFALIYVAVYSITAREYYKLVK